MVRRNRSCQASTVFTCTSPRTSSLAEWLTVAWRSRARPTVAKAAAWSVSSRSRAPLSTGLDQRLQGRGEVRGGAARHGGRRGRAGSIAFGLGHRGEHGTLGGVALLALA